MGEVIDRLEAEKDSSPALSSPRPRRPSSPAATSTCSSPPGPGAGRRDRPRWSTASRVSSAGSNSCGKPVVAAINGARPRRRPRARPGRPPPRRPRRPRHRDRPPRGHPRPPARRPGRRPRRPHARAHDRADGASCCRASGTGPGRALDRPRRRAGLSRRTSSWPRPRPGSPPTPTPVQPWDQKGYKIPGGTPSSPRARRQILAGCARQPAQAAEGRPLPRAARRSWPPPSRAPRSTSTTRWPSRAATSSRWSPARSRRT